MKDFIMENSEKLDMRVLQKRFNKIKKELQKDEENKKKKEN